MTQIVPLIVLAINVIVWLIVASVIISWLSHVVRGSWIYAPIFDTIIRFGRMFTEPVRRLLERYKIPCYPFDWSPMVVIFGLNFLEWLILAAFGVRR